ncbi:hypothetical protein BJY04DRAFT_211860 [Aspergillus karnatakaensis]|uniref:Pfs, NB-ARC and Ankyrin domain protein n=1 Tax=Aspergillus karnatakaensis TaxID=1810916 RepID=UPI003CCCDAAE
MKRRRPCASDFSIGWICPLALEYTAAVRVLDEEYDDSDSEYTTGRIHNHNVVISCMPAGIPGTNAAASTATRMLAAYPSLKSLLLVGIAGGVPSDNTDIRLGDVVVGQPMGQYGGVVQYDFQKTLPGTFQRIGSLNAPSHSLLTAISKFKSSLSASTTRDRMRQYLTDRPPAGSDVLFQASYDHVGLPIDTCRDCRTDMIAERSQRETEFGIFFGTIASGNQVIKYGRTRDEISSTLGGILCFEMEAAGVVNLLPCLVVRGICDYADSHKNKIFQPFAASAAAAFLNSSERQRAVSSKEQVGLSAEEQQLYHESLAFKQLDSRHQTVKMAHAKTCRWILSYLFDQHHGFLWIKGKPGAGKSTIMKFAFTQSQKLANTARISFFFNARGDTLEKTVLFEQRPELHTVFTMLPTTTTLGPTPTWDIETLKYLLRACVERLQSEDQPVLCYIDALDECDEQEIRDMVSFFEQIGELVVSKKVRLHICFSSRHYPHVTIEHSIELVLEDQDGHQQDIMNYVLQIKDEIILRSSGIFLWVVLVIQILNKEFDRGRIHALKQRLKEIPDGLHSLLKDIFTRDNNDMANTLLCLQWILYAARPLSREEAYFAILAGTMSSIDLVGWTAEQVDKEVMRKFLLDSSKGLTELTRGKTPTVQFIHESVRDFLREEGFADLSLGNIALGPSHEALKKCCLNYLSIDLGYLLPHLEWLPSAKSTECRELRNKVSAQCPFLAYAVENVLHHADIASGHGLQQTAVVTNFPSDAWTLGNNLYERHGVRRYSSNDSMYIFAERNYANLLKETIAADGQTATRIRSKRML